ncbi:MAG: P-loop NTPase fold protein [Gracilimonas sp.]
MKTIIPPFYEHLDTFDEIPDFFKRETFRNNLTRLLKNTEEPLVVALDAKWGEGKTTFIKLWERDLLENHTDVIPIYYDAFKNDFSNEVFISIAVTIQKEITKYYDRIAINSFSEERIKFYQNTAKKVGQELTKIAGTSAINFLSAGMVDTSNIWGHMLSKAIKFDDLENEELTNEKYDAFLEMQGTIRAYRNELKSLLNLETENSPKKIVFFVDELDRCKPLFAVEVIEKIKHLFSTEGVQFVLSINKEQLLNTIRSAYGVSENEANIYLQKFVHIEANLPSVLDMRNRSDKSDNLIPYLKFLKDSFEIRKEYLEIEKVNMLISTLNHPSQINFVPRSIERLLTFFVTALKSANHRYNSENWHKLFFLCLLKLEAVEVYRKAKTEKRFNLLHWKNKNLGYSLGQIQRDLEGNYFDENEYKRTSGSSTDRFDLIDFEKAFELVDMYDIPKPPKKFEEMSTNEILNSGNEGHFTNDDE